MPVKFDTERPHFWIRVRCQEEQDPPLLLDVYSFMHDFNLVYEISRAATDPNYDFPFSQLRRSHAEHGLHIHLRDEDRMYLESMTKKSPMDFTTAVVAVPAAVGAIWGLVQTIEKVVNFRLNRKKLQEEVKKLELENARSSNVPEDESPNSTFLFENKHFLESRLEERGVIELYRRTGQRLTGSNIEIVDIEIALRGIRSPNGSDRNVRNGKKTTLRPATAEE